MVAFEWLLLLITLVAQQFAVSASATAPPIALAGCKDHCGNISIPYPFGIGPNCFHNSLFEILCNETFVPPVASLVSKGWIFLKMPFFFSDKFNIIRIDLGASPNYGPTATGSLSVSSYVMGVSSKTLSSEPASFLALDLRGSPYIVAGMRNSLLVLGCGGSVGVTNIRNQTVVGCSTICSNMSSTMTSSNNSCFGSGCCQNSIPTSLDYFNLEYQATTIKGSILEPGAVSAAVVDNSVLASNTINGSSFDQYEDDFPTLLLWTVPDLPTSSPFYSNSLCDWDANLKGYSCRCRYEYHAGNPYLPNGCQAIKECEQCANSCTSVVVGNTTSYRCPPTLQPKSPAMSIALGLGISLGSLLLSIVVYGLCRLVKKRKQIRQKQNNFKKNGGLLLQQQISSSEGVVERTKLFTCNELERTTDNFNENRILGREGQGIVYKGMLTNGTIVAIKKSKKIDESQLGQFINEVVILSEIKHKNVVKLFGCCLETEVPLLVYEFVPNGTLFQHIHNPIEDFRITWQMRLQIIVESAEAIAYLHSSSHIPIYHRDIKTSNILLDDKFTSKVSDFGTSKTISIDQTHLTTCIQGTFGYIDPEFFQTNHFTDKSDVYSFGIVLVELLTSRKPFYTDTESVSSRSLASDFLFLMQSSSFYDIVDTTILEEASKEELDGVANIAKECLQLNGKQRPTMKEVAIALQMIVSQNHVDPHSINNHKDKKL